MKQIYIYGASGHGLVVADIAKACGYTDIQFIDDGINNYTSFEEIKNTIDAPIALGIGDNMIRHKIFNIVEKHGCTLQTLIHPSAIVSKSVQLGKGTVVMPLTVINANTTIGKATILNTASIVEHENSIGNFVHISPNVACAGNVKIGDFTHIGIGSCIIQGIHIGNSTVIGAGSIIVKNIESQKLAYGNPCKVKKDISNE